MLLRQNHYPFHFEISTVAWDFSCSVSLSIALPSNFGGMWAIVKCQYHQPVQQLSIYLPQCKNEYEGLNKWTSGAASLLSMTIIYNLCCCGGFSDFDYATTANVRIWLVIFLKKSVQIENWARYYRYIHSLLLGVICFDLKISTVTLCWVLLVRNCFTLITIKIISESLPNPYLLDTKHNH